MWINNREQEPECRINPHSQLVLVLRRTVLSRENDITRFLLYNSSRADPSWDALRPVNLSFSSTAPIDLDASDDGDVTAQLFEPLLFQTEEESERRCSPWRLHNVRPLSKQQLKHSCLAGASKHSTLRDFPSKEISERGGLKVWDVIYWSSIWSAHSAARSLKVSDFRVKSFWGGNRTGTMRYTMNFHTYGPEPLTSLYQFSSCISTQTRTHTQFFELACQPNWFITFRPSWPGSPGGPITPCSPCKDK